MYEMDDVKSKIAREQNEEIEALREENARLRDALTSAYYGLSDGDGEWAEYMINMATTARTSAQAPEAKGKSGEATELRDALELMVDAAMGSGDATQALSIARALLADAGGENFRHEKDTEGEDIAQAVIGYLWPDGVGDDPTPSGIRQAVRSALLARHD